MARLLLDVEDWLLPQANNLFLILFSRVQFSMGWSMDDKSVINQL
jgi:hypothetical protein